MAIKKVWIEEGCIVCGSCASDCPDVFRVTDDACLIKASVREDGIESENREEGSPLRVEVRASLEAGIRSAASGCPVEVIRFE